MRKVAHHIFLFCLVIFAVLSCLEPFDFEPETFERLVVIDGQLTNESKAHQVILSYTYPLDSTEIDTRIRNAEVFIEDEEGNREYFIDEGDGTYKSRPDLQGEVGKKYRLSVRTDDNQNYLSYYETLQASPGIDSIYDYYAELPAEDSGEKAWGIQFFVDSYDENNNSTFFRYEWVETYKIVTPFPSYYEVVGDTILPRIITPGICYKSDSSNNILIGNSLINELNRIVEYPIRFIPQSSIYLRSRYSILVRQYSISETAYSYFRKLRENNESAGSLFDKQTGTITGNIYNVDEPNQPVLGYFEVSGVTQKRAFFNPSDYDERFVQARFPYGCFLDDATVLSIDSAVIYMNTAYYEEIAYIERGMESFGLQDSVYIFNKTCTNCRVAPLSATTNVPDFWVD